MTLLALLIAAQPSAVADSPQPTPFADVATWFSADDYPPSAMRSGEEGAVTFSLAVTATGAVTGCTIVASSGFADLDAQTCATAMRHASFSPAVDKSGKPVPSTFTRRTRWILPNQAAGPVIMSKKLIDADLDVDAAGKVISCHLSPHETAMVDICAAFPVGSVTPVDLDRPAGPAKLKAILLLGTLSGATTPRTP